MADTFITQCPHCGTSFRVKEEHLAVANGSVRCGACLQVFSARNHMVRNSQAAAGGDSGTAAAAKRTPQRQKPKTGRSAGASPAASDDFALQVSQQDSGFAADEDDDADFLFSDDGVDDEEEFVFQDSDDDLQPEDQDDSELGELSDHFLNLHNQPDDSGQSADPFERETAELEHGVLETTDEPDESWAESILEELEREEKQNPPAQFKARDPKPAPHSKAPDQPSDFESEPDPAESPGRASHFVQHINHEIDLDFKAEDRLGRLRWLGGVFALLLLVTLALQGAWLQRDTLAKMDQWRGLYLTACDVIGCQLPPQVDLEQVRTSNVLVRDHKVLDDVRLLDAVLTNQAPFKQPFPTLVLEYTNVNGELVADQAFPPGQYLRGELTGSTEMPRNTRVYVSIPIKAPGPDAVNYQLRMVPS